MVTILNYPHCFHTALPILGHEAQQARVKAANSWIRKALIQKKKDSMRLGFCFVFLTSPFLWTSEPAAKIQENLSKEDDSTILNPLTRQIEKGLF